MRKPAESRIRESAAFGLSNDLEEAITTLEIREMDDRK